MNTGTAAPQDKGGRMSAVVIKERKDEEVLNDSNFYDEEEGVEINRSKSSHDNSKSTSTFVDDVLVIKLYKVENRRCCLTLDDIPGLGNFIVAPRILENSLLKIYEAEGRDVIEKFSIWEILLRPYQKLNGKRFVGTILNLILILWTLFFSVLSEVLFQERKDENGNNYWEYDFSFRNDSFKLYIAAFCPVPLVLGLMVKFLIDNAKCEVLGFLNKKIPTEIQYSVAMQAKWMSQRNGILCIFLLFVSCPAIFFHYYIIWKPDFPAKDIPNKIWLITNNFWALEIIGWTVMLLAGVVSVTCFINYVSTVCMYMCANIAAYQYELRKILNMEFMTREKGVAVQLLSTTSLEEHIVRVMDEVKNKNILPMVTKFYNFVVIIYVLIITFLLQRFSEIWAIQDEQEKTSKITFAVAILISILISFYAFCQPMYFMAEQSEAWRKVVLMLEFHESQGSEIACKILARAEAYTPLFIWSILGGEVSFSRIRSLIIILLQSVWGAIFLPRIIYALGLGGNND